MIQRKEKLLKQESAIKQDYLSRAHWSWHSRTGGYNTRAGAITIT
jgi:hypothetical protein